MKNDTICAISTAPGMGAIALVRLSGPDAIEIASKVFYPSNRNTVIREVAGNTIHYGTIRNNEHELDDVLVSVFMTPNSYTGEDSVEISCHGSVYIQQQILQLLIDKGARLAVPGEFTQRAFLNGKLDLSQAEGVADLIASGTAASHQLALSQIRGGFSDELRALRSELLNLGSLIELELDFSEEDVEFADRTQLGNLIHTIGNKLKGLIATFRYGNAIKEGIPVVIVGKTNAGKSTLLNRLLREDKAIVTHIPGTTRDSLEDTFTIEGFEFRFIDTAGLRETDDVIEAEGIRRALKKARQAQVVLFMVDASGEVGEARSLYSILEKEDIHQKHLILVINKIDKEGIGQDQIDALEDAFLNLPAYAVSASEGDGIEQLEAALVAFARQLKPEGQDVVVTNMRHYEALSHAYEAINRIDEGLHTGLSTDLIAIDIRQVLHFIGEITGEISNDEVLGNIFKNFCIGK